MFGFSLRNLQIRHIVSTRRFSVICFLAGLLILGNFSASLLGALLKKFTLIPSIVDSQQKSHAFSCASEDCAACLQGVHDNPRGIVFTSGSSFRYALDLEEVSKAMPVRVLGCILNDHRLDAFTLLFGGSKQTHPEQVVVHGYNSWAVNSPGTWRGLSQKWHFRRAEAGKKIADDAKTQAGGGYLQTSMNRLADASSQYLLYVHIFISRTDAETPAAWRLKLNYAFGSYKNWEVAYWPLSKQAHQERRVELMKRWFDMSQWTRSFAIGMDRVQPREEIERRHREFFEALSPAHRFVLIPAPEMREIFPDSIQEVMSQSKATMLDIISKYPNVKHIDIDYVGCGLKSADFWMDALMAYDPVHPQPSTATKVTECVIKGLKAAGINDFVGQGR